MLIKIKIILMIFLFLYNLMSGYLFPAKQWHGLKPNPAIFKTWQFNNQESPPHETLRFA